MANSDADSSSAPLLLLNFLSKVIFKIFFKVFLILKLLNKHNIII